MHYAYIVGGLQHVSVCVCVLVQIIGFNLDSQSCILSKDSQVKCEATLLGAE